jgi:gamma-glutamyltranspeptidase / glutathione hydrolase
MHIVRTIALGLSLRGAARALLCCALCIAIPAWPQDKLPEGASGWTSKAPVRSQHFMVASANPLATNAGYDILRAGGSAVDAAIAIQLVLGLVEPQSSGLGGGALMLHHDGRSGRLLVYDARETAPAAARPDRFLDHAGKPLAFYDAVIGGRSVGVPGTMRLLETAHRAHGRLPWARLFQPAIALAESGFAISPRLHSLIAAETHFVQPHARSYFLQADGQPRATGSLLRNPEYAATLRTLAQGGADGFYTGAIAQDVVDTADQAMPNPGDLTLADLAAYRVQVRAPVCGAYRGYRVCGTPPPSSGGYTGIEILKLLEPYDIGSMAPAGFWSVHFISEAGRLAYADRVYIADPAFVPMTRNLLDDTYLRERSLRIRTSSSMRVTTAGDPPVLSPSLHAAFVDGAAAEFPSTSHIAIVDASGNAVSMTSTIEDAFGSRLMTAGGFLLNNELTDFAFVPSDNNVPVANRVEPGKRPRSSMAPTIVYDAAGRLYMIVGSPGGPAIINYVVKAIIGVIDWKLDPQAAVDLPNIGSRNGPTELEADTPVVELAPRLRALGHDIRILAHPSGLQAIVRTKTGWIGGADARREGTVRGD